VSEERLKLTIYFGERDRAAGRFLADVLLEIFEAHEVGVSVLLRGAEGFGAKQGLRSDRLLTLSEDLPLVAVAVDAQERIEEALREVEDLSFDGLVTLERARLLHASADPPEPPDALDDLGEAAKLTLYMGRGARLDGRNAHAAAVDLLRGRGIDGASVLLGIDGTLRRSRQRARFFSRNADVPLMVISVGPTDRVVEAAAELARRFADPLMTLERVRVLKRDGSDLADPGVLPEHVEGGMGLWQKLMLYSSEATHFNGRPVHIEAIRRLRREGAAGATALRGVWGYHGDHAPHGDTFWSLRRHVPTLTVVVDSPARTRRWLRVLDEVTPERGLITSEIVPAFRATGPEISRGGLRLAARWRW